MSRQQIGAKGAPITGRTPTKPATSLKERILDLAADLFVRHGYAETSMREIADELGVSKAALYYHYESKQDILLALHMRLHELTTRDLLPVLQTTASDSNTWKAALDHIIEIAVANRRLLEVHLRNAKAIGELHAPEGHAKHGTADFEVELRLRSLLGDPSIAPNQRVRRIASLGAIASVILGSAMLSDIADESLTKMLRSVVDDVL